MKRVQILAGIGDPAQSLAAKAKRDLAHTFELVVENPDLYVVVGGDGTLLHYLRELNYPGIPFLGVDGGSLGFFQEIGPKDLTNLADRLKQQKYALQNLPLLELTNYDGKSTMAFNEFAIERASARAAHISLTLDNHRFEKFIGDGLIISTPQGSTAYAGAAGGAIIPYDIEAFQVVPSNPHQSALYKALRQPLILGKDAVLKLDVLSAKDRPIRVVSDGNEITVGDSFEVRLSKQNITMLRTHDFDFYSRLSQKLIG